MDEAQRKFLTLLAKEYPRDVYKRQVLLIGAQAEEGENG